MRGDRALTEDCVCAAAGGVYSWGRGLFGRLGVGVFQDELIPTHIAIGANPDDDDGAGSSHSGSSHSSQGREDTSRAHSARDRVDGAARSKATQVAAGAYHNLALTAGGSVWSWGYNACILLSTPYRNFSHELHTMFACLCPTCTASNSCSLTMLGRSAWSWKDRIAALACHVHLQNPSRRGPARRGNVGQGRHD